MSANDFNSPEISGRGEQDDEYRDGELLGDEDGALSRATGPGRFPKLTPRKFAEEDDDLAVEGVPPMEQLPVPGGAYHSYEPTYGPPPSYDTEAERYVGWTPQPPDVYPASQYGTPRTPNAAPPLPTSGGYLARDPQAPVQPAAQAPPMPVLAAPPARASGGAPGTSGRTERPLAHPPATMTPEPPSRAPGLVPDLAPAHGPVVAETSDVLTADWLLHGRRAQPAAGWRRTLYRATGGLVRVGESAANLRRRDLTNRVRTPVAGGHHRVAVMSLKGGVGKTTTAVGLGATLASLRGDRVIAMDANPDRGTLSDKVRLETAATVRDLLNDRSLIRRYADVRQFTSQAPSRLEILASDRDPGVSIAFSADDYREVSRLLEHFYSISITDCGTGLLHSAMSGILELADHIVLVSSPSVDGARSASATLDWLEAHQYTDLVRSAVVVMSTIRPRSKSTVDLDRLEAHFASRCRDVVRIPYDAHLEEGAEVELDLMGGATQDAFLALAATVADGFAVPRRAMARPATRLP
jgi:MinD-like ATPase involved in chromosome partitioning or flagellar assembly